MIANPRNVLEHHILRWRRIGNVVPATVRLSFGAISRDNIGSLHLDILNAVVAGVGSGAGRSILLPMDDPGPGLARCGCTCHGALWCGCGAGAVLVREDGEADEEEAEEAAENVEKDIGTHCSGRVVVLLWTSDSESRPLDSRRGR